MEYRNICKGTFISRPNRFIARIDLDGREVQAHVKNTGRCRELLLPGAQVFLQDHAEHMGKRKLRYSLITVKKGDQLVNLDSQAPNRVVKEALECGVIQLPHMGRPVLIQGEKTFGASRFDFYIEDEEGKKGFIEVKGVTLEEAGIAAFPDAPTERGLKHLEELIGAQEQGYIGYVIFVIQMKGVREFRSNDRMHRAFGDTLRKAARLGIHVLAYDCLVQEDGLIVDQPVPWKG